MKHTLLTTLLSAFCLFSFAQNTVGVRAGIGVTTAYRTSVIPTPGLEGYLLKKVSPRWSIGGAIAIQKYSLDCEVSTSNTAKVWDILSISQRSTYVFLSPKFDVGVGKHQNIHAFLSLGPGLLARGTQSTDFNVPFSFASNHNFTIPDSMLVTTNKNINVVIFRVQAGLNEIIHCEGRCCIYLFQEFSYIPSNVSVDKDRQSSNSNKFFLKTNYLSVGIGINQVYGKPHIKQIKQKAKKKKISSPFIED